MPSLITPSEHNATPISGCAVSVKKENLKCALAKLGNLRCINVLILFKLTYFYQDKEQAVVSVIEHSFKIISMNCSHLKSEIDTSSCDNVKIIYLLEVVQSRKKSVMMTRWIVGIINDMHVNIYVLCKHELYSDGIDQNYNSFHGKFVINKHAV